MKMILDGSFASSEIIRIIKFSIFYFTIDDIWKMIVYLMKLIIVVRFIEKNFRLLMEAECRFNLPLPYYNYDDNGGSSSCVSCVS